MSKPLTSITRITAVILIPALLFVVLTGLTGCSQDPDDPKQQIREMIGAGEEAVEARSIMKAIDFIADSYQDKVGRGKQEMKQLIAGYLLRNKSIHLLTRVQHITLNEEKTRADVVLLVGMAGVPLPSVDQLVYTRADLYRFDLSLMRGDDWQIVSGSWHQARLEDF